MTLDTRIQTPKPATIEELAKRWGWPPPDEPPTRSEKRDYDPNEPRDDHGRWTSDGGGETQDVAIDGLPKGWTATKVNRKSVNVNANEPGQPYMVDNEGDKQVTAYVSEDGRTRIFDNRGGGGKTPPIEVVQAIDTLESKYPLNFESLDVIMSGDMPNGVAGTTTWATEEANGHYDMELNAHLYDGRNGAIEKAWTSAIENRSFMPSATVENVKTYAVFHEYGHIADGTGGINTGPGAITNVENNFMQAMNSRSVDTQEKIVGDASRYAMTKATEGMAEGFADYAMTDGKSTNAWTQQVIKAMQDAGTVKK